MAESKGKFAALHEDLLAGRIDRRRFMARALALGVGMPVLSFVMRAYDVKVGSLRGVGGFATVAAQESAGGIPAVGTEGQTRGAGGEVKILLWQAPTVLTPHASTGTKDYIAAEPIFEPLMHYLADGSLAANLITEVPSVENGLLAEDLTSVTYKLLDGVLWSDGQPLTADDVVFTWQWISNTENASTSIGVYEPIQSIEAVDPLTAKVTFTAPNANWFEPHTGTTWGQLYPKHVLEGGADANAAFAANPVGTGPYKMESFSPGDQVIYVMNENYREPNKPFFERVNIKGGGDAASAARAVLQTGDFDYAWNMQVEPQVLAELEQGGKGKVVVVRGTSVEALRPNFSDPNQEVDGQRSEKNTPHPFLTDPAVRQAIALASDRATISNQFYAGEEFEPPTANILAGIPAMESPTTTWAYDIEQGKQLLEAAGWTMQGDVRAKDGVELRMTYVTSINPVRQKVQAVLKPALEEMGFRVQLKQVDAGIFFDSSAGNEQNFPHFYDDMQMYTNNASSPFPTAYMISWYAGPDGENIAQKSNNWTGQNSQRYNNPEYDKVFDAVRLETDLEAAAQMFIQLNDILIADAAVIPLVNRAADKYAISLTLRDENIGLGPFENNLWNIANWNRVS